MFQENESDGNYVCINFGFTDDEHVDNLKPRIFLLFTGSIDHGHFRLLHPSITSSYLNIKCGNYSNLTKHGINERGIFIKCIDEIITHTLNDSKTHNSY